MTVEPHTSHAAGDDPWVAPVRALLLDVDDTLVDTQSAMRSSCATGAAAAWPERPASVHEAISGWFYDDPSGYFDAYTRGEFPFEQMRAARYHEACRRVGVPRERFGTFEAAYRTAFANSQVLFDDAVPFLDAAERAHVPVAFVTNSGEEQTRTKLAAVGLAGAGAVVTTDTLGVGKPDRAIFDHALGLLGAGAHDALVVGDTLHTDVAGAQAAGMRAAWLQRPGLPEPRNAGWGTPLSDPRVRVVGSLTSLQPLLSPR